MKDVFVSIRGRVALNAEALNMTESIGNYIKRRRVPIMLKEEAGTYAVYFMPAISGESIAHGLQTTIAEKAQENKLPVCKLCSKGIFLKSSRKNIFKEAFGEKADDKDIEKTIVSGCVVEDIGGFLYAEEANVKRTSNFYTGYMIPTYESLRNTVIEPQLHSRYALGTRFVDKEKGQMLYYVEISSSVYTFSLDIDTNYIGKLTFNADNVGELVINENERLKRVLAMLDAVKAFLVENSFGAKKTRFLPLSEWESMVIAASDRTWTVPSSFTIEYITKARQKKEKINNNTELYIYDGGSFETFIADTIDNIKARVSK